MKDILIILHGLGRRKNAMHKIARHFQSIHEVYNIGYPSLRYDIPTLVAQKIYSIFKQLIDTKRPINFVTHSMGGILVRYMAAHYSVHHIKRVVMLAPPNQGSELASMLYPFHGRACRQLRRQSDSLVNQLGDIPFECGIIAGNQNIYHLLNH